MTDTHTVSYPCHLSSLRYFCWPVLHSLCPCLLLSLYQHQILAGTGARSLPLKRWNRAEDGELGGKENCEKKKGGNKSKEEQKGNISGQPEFHLLLLLSQTCFLIFSAFFPITLPRGEREQNKEKKIMVKERRRHGIQRGPQIDMKPF